MSSEQRIDRLEFDVRALWDAFRTDIGEIKENMAKVVQKLESDGIPGDSRMCRKHANDVDNLVRRITDIELDRSEVRGAGKLAKFMFPMFWSCAGALIMFLAEYFFMKR